MPKSLLEKMTREELIEAVKSYSCGKLRTLPLEYMTKDQIVQHLKNCECPLIQKLLSKQL